MHCSGNYFSTKQVSDKDVEVEAGAQDETYLGILQAWLPYLTKTIQPGVSIDSMITFLVILFCTPSQPVSQPLNLPS